MEQLLVVTRKILKNETPRTITKLAQISGNERHSLGSNNIMWMSRKAGANAMKHSFSYIMDAKICNAVPPDLRNLFLPIDDYKRKLRIGLKGKYSFFKSILS